ncbi:glutathione S-transferase family protein [Thioclava sp. A2]|uniref:glutathione S-transferase family protein n=1 Tax=Thioclava sp. FCG-A2 TaxID=3080562 RepID=UPI002955CA41|nr:glutathione S-transferase family protein [Thioclava sp. A2]MDV7270346.1 glutathione S-transferase family protein [Thioclava sp. A2]
MILYHSPNSRSSTIVSLLHELGARDKVDVRVVSIPRQDGSGGRDAANPHPEGKVPYLVNGEDTVRERGAIVAYLCEAFPEAGLAPMPGEAKRGEFLSWLFYYQGVLEPVLVGHVAEVKHPAYYATFRDMKTLTARLTDALQGRDFLLGDRFSAADLLMFSPFGFFTQMTPDVPVIKDWVARCMARPSMAEVARWDAELLAQTL